MSSEQAPPKSSSWLWYFIGITLVAAVLLSVLAIFVHNQLDPAQQLKMEQLQAARQMWDAKGSKDYQMLYTVQRGGDKNKDRFFVEVRGGKVQSVIFNGSERLPADKLEYHSMTGLFNDIEIFLHRDAQAGSPPTFCRGYFDGEDGRLLLFVRRVLDGSSEGVEIKVDEFRPVPGK